MSMTPIAESIAAEFKAWQQSPRADQAALIASILDGRRPCYVLGRNVHARFIDTQLALAGFIDDTAAPGERWECLPVLPGDAVPADACVINAVLHRRPLQARRRIHAMAAAPQELAYAELTRHAPERFAPLPFSTAARTAFFEHFDRFADVGSRLTDPASRTVLRDVMLYRMTADADFMTGYSLRDPEQYFDVGLRFDTPPRFVDGGAFRGETTEEFMRRYSDNAGSMLFEPNPDSLARARERLAGRGGVEFHPAALGDRAETVHFDDSAANASKVAQQGGLRIEVVPLDSVVREPVHFVKYDLEGYETKAIDGARRTIQRDHPTLAICVYHDVMDFIDVPRHVLAIRDDYDLQLRHYTEGWEETVMYFLPRTSR